METIISGGKKNGLRGRGYTELHLACLDLQVDYEHLKNRNHALFCVCVYFPFLITILGAERLDIFCLFVFAMKQ